MRLAKKMEVSIKLTTELIEERRSHIPKIGIANLLVALCEEQNSILSKADLGEELGLMVTERIKSGKVGTTKIENELIAIVEKICS